MNFTRSDEVGETRRVREEARRRQSKRSVGWTGSKGWMVSEDRTCSSCNHSSSATVGFIEQRDKPKAGITVREVA